MKNTHAAFHNLRLSSQSQEQRQVSLLCVALALVIFGLLPVNVKAAIEEERVDIRDWDLFIPEDVDTEAREAAREKGFSLLKGAGFIWGVDENVFRSPDDQKKSGQFWGAWGLLRADKRFSEKERLMSTLTWQQIRYPDRPTANLELGELSNWYTRPLTDNTGIELGLRIKHRNDDATTIYGEKYERDYAYWRYAAEGFFVWDVAENHQFKVGGAYVFKDYDETPGLNTLDWYEQSLKTKYRYRFGKSHYLGLSYSLGERNYDEELASLSTGEELAINPKEKHLYQDFEVLYELPLNDRLGLDLGYSYETKDDRFQSYESYTSYEPKGAVRLRVSEKTRVGLEVEYTTRDYEHMRGDGGEKLEYQKYNITASIQHRLSDSVSITGSLAYYNRNTNKSTGTTYRDYNGLLYSMGVSYFF